MSTIRTPELVQAAAALSRLIQAADQGSANVEQGRLLVSATNGQCRVVKTDLDRRLSDGKLREMEAKVISDRGDDAEMSALPDRSEAPSSGSVAALLRAAAEMLERSANDDERSGNAGNAGSARTLEMQRESSKAAA